MSVLGKNYTRLSVMIGDLQRPILYISSSNDIMDRIQCFLIKNNDYNESFNRVHYVTPGIRREKMGETPNGSAGYYNGLFIDANRYRMY
jgi:hypothetical protein